MMPRIAIPVPTFGDPEYNQLNWQAYAEAIRANGGEAVRFELSMSRAEATALAASCGGVCLPGSPADVAPSRYGQSREEGTADSDEARETVDSLLIEQAFEQEKPLLAICFGLQMLNVCRGGTLLQDLSPMPVNHAAGRSVFVAHMVEMLPGTLLEAVIDESEGLEPGSLLRVPVNSSHHQAVGIVGDGLRVVARCPQDGVVEAVERVVGEGGGFMLGVQWHPERTVQSASSRRIFERFIGESARWAERQA